MSKSGMLRSRRRDLNVKPNRRLDRKSSRGMIYENEELRLRTININAEIERGQSDIKKLRRENEQLRKEIWCLRDEYEKLDKLLKEKTQEEMESCSSCTSEVTDSCSSCTESEDNETSQNIQNVHKTALNGLRAKFDDLSVVTEETSAENSDKNSSSALSPPNTNWTAIQPDQSYPIPGVGKNTMHFFAPLRPSKSADDCCSNGLQHGSCWSLGTRQAPLLAVTPPPYTTSLQTCEKTAPDVLVHTDCEFPNYTQRSTNSSFTNGGNLDELLKDIQTISNDILTISTQQNESQTCDDNNFNQDQNEIDEEDPEKPFKSELNVVLLPKPMPLLGFDKYQTLSSRESLNVGKSTEQLGNVSPIVPQISPLPPPLNETCFIQSFPTDLLGFTPTTTPLPNDYPHPEIPPQSNPFYFSLPNYENYQNVTIGGAIPTESYAHDNPAFKGDIPTPTTESNEPIMRKTHTDNESNEGKDTTCTSRQVEQINEELETQNYPEKQEKKPEIKDEPQKSPTSRRTRKVSIYFKGKKDKFTRSLSLDTKLPGKIFEHTPTPKPVEKSPLPEKKTSKVSPKFERKISAPLEQKSNSLEQKQSSFEQHKLDQIDKNFQSDGKTSSDSKNSEKKHRKSSSTSPERKHGHKNIDEGQKKCHKRRHRKLSTNRSSLSVDRARERSFSICTDRSNILDHRFGGFDELTNSERDRSNSISSCDTVKSRKLSNLTNLPPAGKIPWFGCWGNGCL